MFEGALCKQFALKVFCVFKLLMLVSGVFRWTLYSFKNMYEASNPLFREAVFYLVWGFLWKLGYMCSFSLIWHFLKLNHVQFKYLKFKCCGFFNWFKKKTFWQVKNVNNTLEHEKVVSQHIACFWYVRFLFFRSSHSSLYTANQV